MKFILLSFFILHLSAFILSAAPPAVGEWELRQRTSTGFISYGVTAENGKAIGFTAGVPAMLTIGSGSFSDLTGKPTTLAGYGISDAITAANAASTYATITNLALKAPLASPTFIGTVTIPSGASISGYLTSATAASTYAALNGASMTNTALDAASISNSTIADSAITTSTLNGITIPASAGTTLTITPGLTLSITGPLLTTTGDGGSLTNLNASSLASGTVGTARLGTGTANSTTYLRGDGTWATVTGGVTSITGTANQITVTGTTTPTLSLPATITGLTSVTSTTFVGALTGTASGNAVLTGNAFTGGNTTTVGTNSATPAAGESLTNSTAAISGTQSASPSLIWTGQGWKTTATAASQAVAFRSYVLPVQGTTAPTGTWILQSSINGGAYADRLTVDSAGLVTAPSGVYASDFRLQAGTVGSSIERHGADMLLKSNDTYTLKLYGASRNIVAGSGGGFGWSSDTNPYTADADTRLYRDAVSIIAQRNSTAAQTFRIYETDSGSNDEYLEISAASTGNYIKPVATGTGTASLIRYYPSPLSWFGARAGTPESTETAGIGSLCTDTTTGDVYRKVTGYSNTGWQVMPNTTPTVSGSYQVLWGYTTDPVDATAPANVSVSFSAPSHTTGTVTVTVTGVAHELQFSETDTAPSGGDVWVDTSGVTDTDSLAAAAAAAWASLGFSSSSAGGTAYLGNAGTTGTGATLSGSSSWGDVISLTGGGSGTNAVAGVGAVTEVTLAASTHASNVMRPMQCGWIQDALHWITIGFYLKTSGGTYTKICNDIVATTASGTVTIGSHYTAWASGVTGASLVAKFEGAPPSTEASQVGLAVWGSAIQGR